MFYRIDTYLLMRTFMSACVVVRSPAIYLQLIGYFYMRWISELEIELANVNLFFSLILHSCAKFDLIAQTNLLEQLMSTQMHSLSLSSPTLWYGNKPLPLPLLIARS